MKTVLSKSQLTVLKTAEKYSTVQLFQNSDRLVLEPELERMTLYFAVKIGVPMGITTDPEKFIAAIKNVPNPSYKIFDRLDDATNWMNLPLRFNPKEHKHLRPAEYMTATAYPERQYTLAYLHLLNTVDEERNSKPVLPLIYYAIKGEKIKAIYTDPAELKQAAHKNKGCQVHTFKYRTQAQYFIDDDDLWKSGAWQKAKSVARLESNYRFALSPTDSENKAKCSPAVWVRQWHMFANALHLTTGKGNDMTDPFLIVADYPVARFANGTFDLKVFDKYSEFINFMKRSSAKLLNVRVFMNYDDVTDFANYLQENGQDDGSYIGNVTQEYKDFLKNVIDYTQSILDGFLLNNVDYSDSSAALSQLDEDLTKRIEKYQLLKSQGKLKRKRSKQGLLKIINTKTGEITIKNEFNALPSSSVFFTDKSHNVSLANLTPAPEMRPLSADKNISENPHRDFAEKDSE